MLKEKETDLKNMKKEGSSGQKDKILSREKICSAEEALPKEERKAAEKSLLKEENKQPQLLPETGENLLPHKPYGKLFTTLLMISACTFGGGFVIVSLMKKKYVDELHWLTEEEMLDLTALSQSSPGAIAVNAAVQLGQRMGGAPGAVVAVLATILPPMVILAVISLFYTAFCDSAVIATLLQGLQIGVCAVLLDVTCNLGSHVVKSRDVFNMLVMAAAFLASFVWKVNIIPVILGTALLGALRALWQAGKAKKEGKE